MRNNARAEALGTVEDGAADGRSRGGSALKALVSVVVGVLLIGLGVSSPAAAATPQLQLTLAVNTNQFYAGQSIRATGVLTTNDGQAVVGKEILLQVRTGPNRDIWKTFATTKTTAGGRYAIHVKNHASFTFRAWATSWNGYRFTPSATNVGATLISGKQTVEQREALLKQALGAPRDPQVKTGSSNGQNVRWRNYDRGMLVEAAGRVFYTYGELRSAYLTGGGPTGRLGALTADMDCGLVEGGCIQSFAGGAIYHNPKSVTAAKTHVSLGKGLAPRLIAVASSQVGYREPGWQTNKYTAWNGLKVPWCGVFQSWVSAAGKNGSAVPQVNTFGALVNEVKRRGVTSQPSVGALVFIDFAGGSNVTHTGIVTKVHANGSVDTIEGNTITGTSDVRVVARKWRSAAQAVYFYVPGT
jgi:CHAP domain